MSLLAKKLDEKAAPPAPAASRLTQALAASPRGAFVEMPIIGRVWVELPGDTIEAQIEGATFAAMEALGLPPTPLNAQTYGSRRLALTLAWSVRNPDKIDEHVGTQDEWCDRVDADLRAACGMIYNDVRERLAPLSMDTLTAEQFDAIRLGIEKKNPTLLLSCGVAALATWLLTTAAQPASSPSMPFSSGES